MARRTKRRPTEQPPEAAGDTAPAKDVALVYGREDDGEGVKILRRRAATGEIESGVVRPLVSGRAITGEVVRLAARKEPLLFDLEVDPELSQPAAARLDHAGPAQVATSAYRRGWDQIWAGKRPPAREKATAATDSSGTRARRKPLVN